MDIGRINVIVACFLLLGHDVDVEGLPITHNETLATQSTETDSIENTTGPSTVPWSTPFPRDDEGNVTGDIGTITMMYPDVTKAQSGATYGEGSTAMMGNNTFPPDEMENTTEVVPMNGTTTSPGYPEIETTIPPIFTTKSTTTTRSTMATTESTTTKVITANPGTHDETSSYLALKILLLVLAVIFVTLCILVSYFMCKYDMDPATFFRALRYHFRDLFTGRYRNSSSNDTEKPRKGKYKKKSDKTRKRSLENGSVAGSTIIATESMADLTKLDTIVDEDSSDEDEEETPVEEKSPLPTTPITIQEYIAAYGAKDVDTEKLKREFDDVVVWSKELPYKKNHAKLERNRLKNRYYDIIPYDYNRVPLYDTTDSRGIEKYREMTPKEKRKVRYVNASYVHEFNSDVMKYIATQGPVGRTVHDFWEMIWQEESDTIVMLTSLREQGKIKCEQYWPAVNKPMQCRDIHVRIEASYEYAYYNYMSIILTKDDTTRRIHHYLYHHWPDKEAPETVLPILDLYRKVFSRQTYGPITVHCSAGVGRTGTFILIDYLLEQAKQTQTVDIMAALLELRKQRVSMVQKQSQYVFLYEAIHEALDVGTTAIPAGKFVDWYRKAVNDEDFIILKHFELMCAKKPKVNMTDCEGLLPENTEKNRNPDVIPDDARRPFLFTFLKGRNSYINAVYVDTFQTCNDVIVTQLPTQSTMGDYWRLVYDRDCTSIILLDDMENPDDDCPIFWPEDGKNMTFGDVLEVRGSINEKLSTKLVTVRDFQIVMQQEGQYIIETKMFQLKSWPRGDPSPKNMLDLLALLTLAKKYKEHGVLVQCFDGCERSGLVSACMYIVAQLEIDQEVDIYHVSRIISASRPTFIQTKEQYKFLHDFVVEYLHTFADYSNYHPKIERPKSNESAASNRNSESNESKKRSTKSISDSSDSDNVEEIDQDLAKRIKLVRDISMEKTDSDLELQDISKYAGQSISNLNTVDENDGAGPPKCILRLKSLEDDKSPLARFSLQSKADADYPPPRACRAKSTII